MIKIISVERLKPTQSFEEYINLKYDWVVQFIIVLIKNINSFSRL